MGDLNAFVNRNTICSSRGAHLGQVFVSTKRTYSKRLWWCSSAVRWVTYALACALELLDCQVARGSDGNTLDPRQVHALTAYGERCRSGSMLSFTTHSSRSTIHGSRPAARCSYNAALTCRALPLSPTVTPVSSSQPNSTQRQAQRCLSHPCTTSLASRRVSMATQHCRSDPRQPRSGQHALHLSSGRGG